MKNKKEKMVTHHRSISMQLLFSYLAIIFAPTIAIIIIYMTMQGALLDIQKKQTQNLSSQAKIIFDKEVHQVENIVKYISSDATLKHYMNEKTEFEDEERYYQAYTLAKSYPDYALLNEFVKNVYIMPREDNYIFCIPQVISNDERGISLLEIGNSEKTYKELFDNLNSKGKGLFYNRNPKGEDELLMLQQFSMGSSKRESGIIAIEIENKQIEMLLQGTLGEDEGVAFLTDKDGNILYVQDQLENHRNLENDRKENVSQTWKDYIHNKGLEEKSFTICENITEYNQWKIITAIPQKELLMKINRMKNMILLLCVVSIAIGIAICFWYWNNSRIIVERYLKFVEKYPQSDEKQEEIKGGIWKRFSSIVERIEVLQTMTNVQKQRIKEDILYKLLYGNYDSEEYFKEELKKASVSFSISFPCYVVSIEIDNLMKQKTMISLEKLENLFVEVLNNNISCCYQMVSIKPLQYAIIIPDLENINSKSVKSLFEKINYILYSKIPINICTGISEKVDTVLELSEAYDCACHIMDYAKYHTLHMPLTLEELPEHQYVVFTVDLEIQLEQTIRKGTREQLEKLINQIMENYFHVSEMKEEEKIFNYNLEIVRCVIFRCLEGENTSEGRNLLNLTQKVKTARKMEEMIFLTWEYFFEKRKELEDESFKILEDKIEKIIEENYSNSNFNLAMIADLLEVSEKKLYRDFKTIFNISFTSYLEALRIRHAQNFLKEGLSIQKVADMVGYSSDYSFRRAFKRVVGVTPSDYQKIH